MTEDQELSPSAMMLRSLRGALLSSVEEQAPDLWAFGFKIAVLTISCPWRLADSVAVLLGGSDHHQKFGLPQPVDAGAETLRMLSVKQVQDVEIDRATSDLHITFFGGLRIDVFNNSSGYEGWQFGHQLGLRLIAQGGGQIAIWDTGPVTEE